MLLSNRFKKLSSKFMSTVKAVAAAVGATAAYVFGGFSTCADNDQYDHDVWTAKTDLPAPSRYSHAASAILGKGYVYCGYGSAALGDCDEYDPVGNAWANKTSAPSPTRYDPIAATISNKGYVVGGKSGSTNLADCDEYSPDTWANKTDTLNAQRAMIAFVISSAGYFCGGLASSKLAFNFQYIPNTWASKTDIPAPNRCSGAGFTLNGKGYLAAGVGAAALQDCDEYNATGNSWANKTDCPAPARQECTGAEVGGKGYLFLGDGVQDCDEYTASTDAWASKTDCPAPARKLLASASI